METVWHQVYFGTVPNEKIGAIPFLFQDEARKRPASFDITFSSGGRVFRYAFSATIDEIVDEALTEYGPDSSEKLLFRRSDPDAARIEFGDATQGSRTEFLRFLAQGTRRNQLFLAECRLRNAAEFAPAYGWIAEHMLGFTADAISAAGPHVAVLLSNNEGLRRELGRFLSAADTHITEIEAQVNSVEHSEVMLLKSAAADLARGDAKAAPGLMRTYHRDPATGEYKLIELFAMHSAGSEQPVPLDISAESDGTRELIRLFPMLLSEASRAETVILDEFGHRIHSLMSRELIRLAAESRSRRQFLFATHDTNLLDLALLRSDEIFFVEKDRDGASSLRNLAEYKLDPALRIENGYLMGRVRRHPVFGASTRRNAIGNRSMSGNIRARRPLDRTKPVLRDASLIVVSVEGETEKSYFDHLKSLLHAPNLQILPLLAANSSPHDVVEELRKFAKGSDYVDGDSLWAVHDLDHHREKELDRATQEARQIGAAIAISVPRFEVWLLWHFQDSVECSGEYEKALRPWLPAFDHGPIKHVGRIGDEHLRKAVERARTADTSPRVPIPSAPCSRVYRIIDDFFAKHRQG